MHCTEAKVLGVVVGFNAPNRVSDDLCRALAQRLSATRTDAGPDVTYEVRDRLTGFDVVRLDARSCELIDAADSIGRAAELIANDAHCWVAQHHPDLLLVHAGAVEWKGVGIVVPGRSHSGKSSLVAALLGAGARYLSDEFAPIDRAGNVHPYPRHLSIRNGEGETTLVPASDFAASTATDPVPVRIIVDAPYVPGSSFEPASVRGAVPLMSLIENALVARSRPAHTMAIVARLVPRVVVLRSPRGDANAAARTILDAIEADPQLIR